MKFSLLFTAHTQPTFSLDQW